MAESVVVWSVHHSEGRYEAVPWTVTVGPDGPTYAQGPVRLALDLAGVRALLPPGLVRRPRQESDEPDVVEGWV